VGPPHEVALENAFRKAAAVAGGSGAAGRSGGGASSRAGGGVGVAAESGAGASSRAGGGVGVAAESGAGATSRAGGGVGVAAESGAGARSRAGGGVGVAAESGAGATSRAGGGVGAAAESGASGGVGSGGDLILGVDTVVSLGARLYGKPEDEGQARATLSALAGRRHVVISGLCLIEDGRTRTAAASTVVEFRALDAALIAWYLATGEWRDRAGGYAIQGRGAALVAGIEGDFLNVVGLPVATLLELAPGLLV
jgi:septum formation protein